MASFPLPRFLEDRRQERQQIAKLTATVVDLDADLRERKHYHDPADARSLRGIPAIGRGVAGAISGTSPHRSVS